MDNGEVYGKSTERYNCGHYPATVGGTFAHHKTTMCPRQVGTSRKLKPFLERWVTPDCRK